MWQDHLFCFSGIKSDNGVKLNDTLVNIFGKKSCQWRKDWLYGAYTAQEFDLDFDHDSESDAGSDSEENDAQSVDADSDSDSDVEIVESSPRSIRKPRYENIVRYVETEMLLYSMYNNKRHLASAIDGLKVSQRKILFGCLKEFGSRGASASNMKVSHIGSSISLRTNYAHGDDSMLTAIIRMAQNYPGSNNVNLLEPAGSFGSRLMLGKDSAAPRYIETRLTPITAKLFPSEDLDILEHLVEESKSVEPKFYVPRLPLLLLNGSSGASTGFNNNVPPFNYKDVIRVIREAVIDEKTGIVEPMPWYDGYTSNELTTRCEEPNKEPKWVFKGILSELNEDTGLYTILELPIVTALDKYCSEFIPELIKKGVLKDAVIDHISENQPRIHLEPGQHWPDTTEERLNVLGLVKPVYAQMNLIDHNGHVRNFKTIAEIVRYWAAQRLTFLERRIKRDVDVVQETIRIETLRCRFIHAIVNEELDIRKEPTEIGLKMEQEPIGIPKDLHREFLAMPIWSLNTVEVNKINLKVEELQAQLDYLKQATPMDVFIRELDEIERHMQHYDATRSRPWI